MASAGPTRGEVVFEIPKLAEGASPDAGSTTETDYEPQRYAGEADDVFYRRIGVARP